MEDILYTLAIKLPVITGSETVRVIDQTEHVQRQGLFLFLACSARVYFFDFGALNVPTHCVSYRSLTLRGAVRVLAVLVSLARTCQMEHKLNYSCDSRLWNLCWFIKNS